MLVVPDSIEPVVGWKGLNIADGVLRSPSRTFQWLPNVPARAACLSEGKTIRTWLAVPRDESGPTMQMGMYPRSEIRYGSTYDNWVYVLTTYQSPFRTEHVFVTYDSDEQPNIPFAGPVDWELQDVFTHGVAPAQRCTCGLYMVKSPTFNYGSILVELFGWGAVIPATTGFKVQFAYPKRIFVPESHSSQRRKLKRYGVPVLGVEDLDLRVEEPLPLLRPAWVKKIS